MRELVIFLLFIMLFIGSCYNKQTIVGIMNNGMDKNKSTLIIIQEKTESGELSSSNLEGEALKDAFFSVVESIISREKNEDQEILHHEVKKYDYVQIVETNTSNNEGRITQEEANAEMEAILEAALNSITSISESD